MKFGLTLIIGDLDHLFIGIQDMEVYKGGRLSINLHLNSMVINLTQRHVPGGKLVPFNKKNM